MPGNKINHIRGEKNSKWKGSKVGYVALHCWVRRNKPKPKFCEECGIKPPREVANISSKYLRNVDDYFGRYGAVDDNDDLVIWVDRVKKYATFAYYGEG